MSVIKVAAPKLKDRRIVLPASKSISNRVLVISALSALHDGKFTLDNLHEVKNISDCDDSQVVVNTLRQLYTGFRTGTSPADDTIDIGAAGTAMRFMTALLAVTHGTHTITGTERMRHRPVGILADALRRLGADIQYAGEPGYPPLRITGNKLKGGRIRLAGNVSSQYVSALLMAGPVMQEGLLLELTGKVVSRPYIDMTIAIMARFGVQVGTAAGSGEVTLILSVPPGGYTPTPYHVESDWSAASYWYEMVSLSTDDGASVILPGLMRDSLQGDSRVAEYFAPLGVKTEFHIDTDGTPYVRLSRTAIKPRLLVAPYTLNLVNQPDLAQTLVVTCCILGIKFSFTGLESLKIKETDRMTALRTELAKLGFDVEEEDSGTLTWKGGRTAPSVKAIDTYQDHRMAMSFAPVAMRTGSITINDPDVVSKSYPTFWNDIPKAGSGAIDAECCGMHEVCEKDSLLTAVSRDIEYYEDEELDRFRGVKSDEYLPPEIEEFQDILETMREDEVAGWVRSLTLRGIALPDELKDEVLMIIGERRQ
ncbi:MAG: 3-phosphoshikimate 1-carboxyvinyltransferase [Bacteroidaceae bacterium]|nr:3-phosphoshikimate 1-carboxyvinyltransferase [Bacteroidaceae bacterium]